MTLSHHPVFVIMLVAVLAPLLTELPVGRRAPVIVLEVLLGIIIGPHVLGLIQVDGFLSTMQAVGMSAVLFMAGMEIDFESVRGRPLSLAATGWLASVVMAFAAVVVLHLLHGVQAPWMTTIALTTTMLGAVLPVLRDRDQLDTPFGRLVSAAGIVGEVGPIVAVSLVLSTEYSTWQEFVFLLVFLGMVALAAAVGMGARPPRLLALLNRTMHASSQLPVRMALLLMATFFVLSEEFGFEGILGAFAAGMIVGLATRGEGGRIFRVKLDAVYFGWLTPFFFVGTGLAFDVAAVTRDLETMLLIPALLLLFVAIRGIPVFLYRNDLTKAQQLPFALFSSVASLSLVVVITQIGLHKQNMNPEIAQALIGAALLSSLVNLTLGSSLLSRVTRPAPRPVGDPPGANV